MGLRIRILHLLEPIPALGSTGTLTADKTVGGGAAIAQSLRRTPGGYFVGWRNKLYFVPDSRIACAEVVDDDEVAVAPPPGAVTTLQEALATTAASQVVMRVAETIAPATATAITAAIIEEPQGPPPEPGSIVMDKHGRFSRVPFPDAPGAAPATAAEPTPEEPAHTMKRSGRGRRSMTDQHAPQAPTALEAAVAEDEGAQE